MKTDMHTHTTASDGQYAPAQLVEKAKAVGLECIAVTDHDTIAGLEEARQAGERVSLRVIPGIEFSAREYHTFHILGYGVDTRSPGLVALCARMKAGRDERTKLILAYLERKGVHLELDDVKTFAIGDVLARPHFARAMVQAGYVSSVKEAFLRYLDGEEYRRNVHRDKPTFLECFEAVHAAGGRVSLAHPYQIKLNDDELDALTARLASEGLDAIECYYPKFTEQQQAYYLHLAQKYGLHITGGSDFHGEKVKPDVPLMQYELDLDWLMNN